MTVVLRFVRESDRFRWSPLWNAYNAFYGRFGAAALDEAITQATWERFLDPLEPMHAVVAEIDSDIVGFAHYLFHRSTTLMTLTCYLQDLFVAPISRGMGIGRRLIEHVYEDARNQRSARVYWQTQETNAAAIGLYEQVADRSGFIVYRKELARVPSSGTGPAEIGEPEDSIIPCR